MNDDQTVEIIKRAMETGIHDDTYDQAPHFTAFLHTPDMIKAEMIRAGFQDIQLIAVEGIFNIVIDKAEYLQDEKLKELILECLRKTESIPELMGCSNHILAIGKK